MRMNQHDYFEIIHLVSGKLTWQIRERFLTQRRGDLCLIGSSLYHRLSEFSSPPVKLIQLSFLPEVIRSSCAHGDDTEYLMPFLLQDSKFPHVVQAKTGIPADVVDMMFRIEERLPATSDLDQLSVKTYLKMILVLLVQNYRNLSGSVKAFEDRQRAMERLRPVFELLEQHYGEPIHLAEASRLIGMSRSRFTHFFRQMTGQPFVSYLNHFRVAHAQKLLRLPGESLSEVSQKVGFCDQSYFGRVFKLFANLTPREYQRKYSGLAKKRVSPLVKETIAKVAS